MKKIIAALIFSAVVLSGCSDTSSSGNPSSEKTASDITAAAEDMKEESPVEFRLGNSPDGELLLTGDHIAEAEPCITQDGSEKKFVVRIKLDEKGSEVMAEATKNAQEEPITISIWCNGEKLCSPIANAYLPDGSLIISGNYTVETANELAKKLCPSQEGEDE